MKQSANNIHTMCLEHNCSVTEAKRRITKINLIKKAQKAETVGELKSVVLGLISIL